jgi:tetratricopeptide (TPR) repeat protein
MRRNAIVLSLIIATGWIAASPRQVQAQSRAQNDPARVLFLEGRNLWDDGRFADAEKKFREALTKYPKADQSDRTAYYLITTLIKQGRFADAWTEIENFNRNYPRSTWKSDVEEKRIALGGRAIVVNPVVNPRIAAPGPPAPFGPSDSHFEHIRLPETITVAAPFQSNASHLTVSFASEVLRLVIEKGPNRGIAVARERLKTDPADPVVVSNLSTIANSGSAQAMPFLRGLAVSAVPNVRSQAIYWIGSWHGDKQEATKVLMETLANSKDKETDVAVAQAFARFNAGERREAFSKMAEQLPMLERIYRNTTNISVRTHVVQAAAESKNAGTIAFLNGVARDDKDFDVRRAAIQALAARKDADVKVFEDILNSVPRK